MTSAFAIKTCALIDNCDNISVHNYERGKLMITNILIEYTVLFGPHKGERICTWFAAEDPEIKRLMDDPRTNGVIKDKR